MYMQHILSLVKKEIMMKHSFKWAKSIFNDFSFNSIQMLKQILFLIYTMYMYIKIYTMNDTSITKSNYTASKIIIERLRERETGKE